MLTLLSNPHQKIKVVQNDTVNITLISFTMILHHPNEEISINKNMEKIYQYRETLHRGKFGKKTGCNFDC